MDLYVERQAIEQMKGGDAAKFLLLFDAYFADLYKYIYRRVADKEEAERIVRLTLLDALGQVQNTPMDVSYLTWLFSLAKPRVWDYLGRTSMPEKRGLIYSEAEVEGESDKEELVEKADKMLGKLSLEEREILRLKFFEEVSDGDVMVVLGMEEGVIGPKIYRVLKRAHFLLFGDNDEGQGVYFGELSGFLARIRELETIEVPEVLKLNLKTDLSGRIERRDFAIEAEEVQPETPFKTKSPEEMPKGSNDPAKIFVEAVREMREEEEEQRLAEQVKMERRERIYDLVDRWKHALVLVPVLLFVATAGFVAYKFFFQLDLESKIARDFSGVCEEEVAFSGDFSDSQKYEANREISDRICEHFEGVEDVRIARANSEVLKVEVDLEELMLKYRFVNKAGQWRIRTYEKTLSSQQESGKILRDNGSA